MSLAGWRTLPCAAAALFRAGDVPCAEELLAKRLEGASLSRAAENPQTRWRLRVRHDDWGDAEISQPIEAPAEVGTALRRLKGAPELPKRDQLHERMLVIHFRNDRREPMRSRKHLLRLMQFLLTGHTGSGVDVLAGRVWSAPAIADELSHDAPLDVSALYHMETARLAGSSDHCVVHTHGLEACGVSDLEILNAAPWFTQSVDGMRAAAFAAVEGLLSPGGPAFELASPGGAVRAVPAAAFKERAATRWVAARAGFKTEARCVLCDPESHRFMGLLSGGLRPAQLFSRQAGDLVFNFSSAATALMAERARCTLPLLRDFVDEFSSRRPAVLVKLGIPSPGGVAEHMWFDVHSLGTDTVDATLLNTPGRATTLRAGDRGTHPIELLTDWLVSTPAGVATPRSTDAMHRARSGAGPEEAGAAGGTYGEAGVGASVGASA